MDILNMTVKSKFDDLFLSIKKVGDYVDVKDYDYENQIYLAVCRFNSSAVRNQGRKLSATGLKDEKGKKFYRVFLIQKNKVNKNA